MAESADTEHSKLPSNLGEEPLNLSVLLDRGWKIFEDVDNTNEALNSDAVQNKVKSGLSMLEEASRMVAQLNLFSRNEELEEIATVDLKYMLLPALLGALTLKKINRDKRLEIIQAAQAYFNDFLKRCKEYNVTDFELPKSTDENRSPGAGSDLSTVGPSSTDLVSMAVQRRAKIERYRQKKELESRLTDVQRAVESGQADEEATRDFYLLNIKKWITVGLEELESIAQEVEILRSMGGGNQGATRRPAQPVRPPMKPFILTKDALQAQVFGSGYPSLPTMSVDDWYEQHRKQGGLPDQGIPRKVPVEEDPVAEEREKEEKEEKEDKDDEETLMKARNWDDWKDTHRRGYGNRHNMG
ncbi:immunoglobulin-binding protein 1 [Takifugu flavidus]|uniref:immunoglobulin-binding protein 1 n=1 Tax=Takifugu flavidus TaxID=433684 RepID=UPI0013067D08|nr:immunoglobulin-binding protein 1 [Takifugu flavidus]TWW55848.1 Immunoglobulin-binding protein 1 B-cell signal transduction molecule alpha 4 [Takifugu flavidus]